MVITFVLLSSSFTEFSFDLFHPVKSSVLFTWRGCAQLVCLVVMSCSAPSQVFLCVYIKEQAFTLVIPLLIEDLLQTPNYSLIHPFHTAFVQLFAAAPAWWNAMSEHPLCFRRGSSRIWVRLPGVSLIYVPSLEWPWSRAMWLSVGRKVQCLHLNDSTLEPLWIHRKGPAGLRH